MHQEEKRTWAQISMSALEHNYYAIREALPEGCRFLGVVKANAYGHGAVSVARKLESLGCEMLAVACLDEAQELKRAGIVSPILILGPTQPQFVAQVVREGFTQAVGDLTLARALSQAAEEQNTIARIHIKLDTGMSRTGILAQDSAAAATQVAELCALPRLEHEGIFTHFANADGDEEYTMLQFTRFLDTLDVLERDYGITFSIRHCAASAAVLNYPCTYLDMVRPGIALYGHYPDESCRRKSPIELEPVMSVFTRVAAVRTIPAGTPVSYGCTHVVDRDTRIAVLPIGYADGFFRLLSDRFWVELGGGRATILGRICMDMCMVDVTDLDEVNVGDVAVVFSADKPLEDASDLVGTISYELLCAVSPRVPRVYLP